MQQLNENTSDNLIIQINNRIDIDNYQIDILNYLGQFTSGVYSFQVNILSKDSGNNNIKELGLLRVGSHGGGLSRELKLRELLVNYKLLVPLLAYKTISAAIINLNPFGNKQESDIENEIENEIENKQENEIESETENNSTCENNYSISTIKPSDIPNELDSESDYLEEECYESQEIIPVTSGEKLILLSYFPQEAKTLDIWLTEEHSREECIILASQICQFFRYIHQQNWCFVSIIPQLIQMTNLIQLFDITNAYPVGEILPFGLLGNYCAPELGYEKIPVNELMSSYTVGALLYHILHKQPLQIEQTIDIQIDPIPRIYQLLKICLSPIPEERFPLSQLLGLLVEIRQDINTPKIQWQTASYSTVGLSTARLNNEDNYGVRQQQISNHETMILGVVADGMGGLSQGELASKIAVETILEEPIPTNFKTMEQRQEWLNLLIQKANESVNNRIKNGGTTLSSVLAIARQLVIAHVGDSRIYLCRQGEIRQISEDHSLVALLVASGQITEEESLTHPDRNVLTKSIGASHRLSDGYIQNLITTTQELSINLENRDILLLCSDGVWDLVPTNELGEIFSRCDGLQLAVDQTIARVINRGASDNATLLALQCYWEK